MTAVEEPQATQFIRQDGHEKVTGAGRYTADLNRTGQLHAAFRYADHTHARILSVDATKARALPGVLAVLTHEDVPDVRYGGMVQDRRLFAKEAVRFEGDIVAGVAALTPEIAREAAALVEVGYEPLPAMSDWDAATAPDAQLVPRALGELRRRGRHGPRPATLSATRRSSAGTSTPRWPQPTSSSRATSPPTPSRASPSSRARSSPSGTATRSPCGRRPRCRTPRVQVWPTRSRSPSHTFG